MNFFACGLPRSGTSLLSALINTHPKISCAQDTALMPALKYSFSDILSQNVDLKKMNLPMNLSPEQLSWRINLETSQYNTEIISQAINQPLSKILSETRPESAFISNAISKYILNFYFLGFQQPDPRKDRAKAVQYLRCFDTEGIFYGDDSYLEMCEKMWKNFGTLLLGKDPDNVSLYGEKHPTNLISSDVIRLCFPHAKYVCILRHPQGVLGSKKDRGLNILDVVNEYLMAMPFLQKLAEKKTIFVRYEDLIISPSSILNQIYSFLGVSHLEDEWFSSIVNNGTYQKYVGSSIDLKRNQENLNKVTKEELNIISNKLSSFLNTFYPAQK